MSSELYDQGMRIRRHVLGSDYVDAAMAAADDFSMPMQELGTEYCWGKIWGRGGLSHRERSMLNLAMIAALNKPNELKQHVGGALVNGVTKEEMREIFLQVAVYCGIPAGFDAFRCAREVFAEQEAAAREAARNA